MKWSRLLNGLPLLVGLGLTLTRGVSSGLVPVKDPNAVEAVDLMTANPPLTHNNFTAATSHGTWFVKFWVSYCGHCRRLAPIWQKVAEDTADLKTTQQFHMGQVDCQAEAAFCNQELIDGYPTMFVYRNGVKVEKVEYGDPNKYDPILNYVKFMANKHMVPATETVTPGGATTTVAALAPAAAATVSSGDTVPAVVPSVVQPTNKTPAQPLGPYNREGRSVVLTEDNFESLIKDGPWFIKFYAPWCIHCQHLAPTWEALAKELAGDIHVGEVDCMSFGSFCNNKGITGYPTLTFYLEGSSVNFSGDRTVESLAKFARESYGTRHKEVESRHELDKSTAGLDMWYLYVFDGQTDAKYLETIQRAARATFMQSSLFTSQDANLLTGNFAIPRVGPLRANVPSLWAFKDGYLRPYRQGLNDFDRIKAWMQKERYSLLSQLTTQNAEEFFDSADLVVMSILDTDTRRVTAEQIENWKMMARQAADDIVVIQHGESELNPPHLIKGSGAAAQQASPAAAAGTGFNDSPHRRFLGLGDNDLGPEEIVAQKIRGQTIRFVWLSIDTWDKYLHRVFGMSRADLPKVVLTRPKDEVFFDRDSEGYPLYLTNSEDLVSAVKASMVDRLPISYTSGFIVGSIRSSFRRVSNSFAWAASHPFTSLFLVGVIGAVIYYYINGIPGHVYKPNKLD
ncbi:hypothetical protein H4R33_004514 [Dimargaris cristalligena]|nr:hypothetical protein H4R33_004514 [Dimargaris cristalligena]